MKARLFLGLSAIILLPAAAVAEQRVVKATPAEPLVWPSQPPRGLSLCTSATLAGIRFTGRHAEYVNADTWYPSWASDGNLYSPWTDGNVNGLNSGWHQCATTGNARSSATTRSS